jgi:hypothetical protein
MGVLVLTTLMQIFDAIRCHFTRGHEYSWQRNIYGDEINAAGGHRSWWKCDHCGWSKLETYLYDEPQVTIRTGFFEPRLPKHQKPWSGRDARSLQSKLARKR